MGIFRKLFNKRKQPESSDTFYVILKNAIFTIVKEGTMSGVALRDIAIKITMSSELYGTVVLNRIENGVEVIF